MTKKKKESKKACIAAGYCSVEFAYGYDCTKLPLNWDLCKHCQTDSGTSNPMLSKLQGD